MFIILHIQSYMCVCMLKLEDDDDDDVDDEVDDGAMKAPNSM